MAIPDSPSIIDRKERMKIPFQDLELRKPEERIFDFDDVVIPFTAKRAIREASRCIHCPGPAPCTKACPVHNDIPTALGLIEQGQFLQAAEIYHQTSTLPEICGRVCPHEQLCQGACPRDKRGEPVLTGALEAFVLDYEREHQPYRIPIGKGTGKNVAVVGAGPAGLTVAEKLVMQGHDVTIFDAKPAPGGLLLYGIPNFKLPKYVVWDKWGDLEKAGVKFVGETYIGRDKTIEQLVDEGFEAIFLGVGSGIDAKMEKTPGTDLPGVYESTDFLIRGNVDPQYLPADGNRPLQVGKRVVVIGGGDTASDCLRTALRLDAQEVTCLYRRTENEMPGGKQDRQMAKEEGAHYRYLTQPIRFIAGEDGQLAAVECLDMELGEPDDSGRRRPVPLEGSNFTMAVDTAILALGYWPDPVIGNTTPELETHNWGLIKVVDEETGATTRPGVYAGGDCVTGPAIVGKAMAAGIKAARAIDSYLMQT